ncbi:MIP/aquaporin family protein [Novosphingobium organovorum]|uniref:MIP/aquaporin family protein n=1 Tax=Novosphingobium organovorum TaxID=2930092 RepID=UPI001FBAD773|nr:MIP/aquaporin family protein [Novosphingobium organovorum]
MSRRRAWIGELISEALAVAIIILIGDSAAAMITLYDPNPYAQAYWGVCIAWGLGVTMAIYVTGSVSGTHANPAVTLALALYRGFPKRKVVPYWIAQVVGGFVGAALVLQLYHPVIDAYNAAHGLTRAGGGAAGVFFTHPGEHVTPMHAFWDEVILTGMLLLGIFAITDEFNEVAPRANSSALMIGLLVAAIGASAGYLEAWALNPARDLGPRLLAWLAGYDGAAFPSPGNYWWVPLAAPLLGGVLGAGLYQIAVKPFLPSGRKPHAQDDTAPATD